MSGCYRFADFELDLAAYSLRQRGERVSLEKLPMEVLILLVRHAGALVGRREIQAALWQPGVFVDHDAAINTAIRKIRQALSDNVERPRFVETVVGKGYRFIARTDEPQPESPIDHDDGRRFPGYLVMRGRHEFVLESGDNLLGRDPAAQVYVNHTSVSRQHARISIRSERATLEDLKSRNGTFLDGRKIHSPIDLHHGAIIGLGPITFTFLVLSAPLSTRPMSGGGHVVD